METIITIGGLAVVAAAAIKIRDRSTRREFEERKAAVLTVAEEQIVRDRYNKEHPQPAKPEPDADKFIQTVIKDVRKREKEQKRLRKWQHYAKHAKKRRIRKKYQKKIREHEDKKWKPIGSVEGNWPYGSGAGYYRGTENPYGNIWGAFGGGMWYSPRPRTNPQGGRRP